MTRREAQARRDAVLKYFREHPDATGDEAQEALSSGKLTGKKGPPLGLGVLYELRKIARSGSTPATGRSFTSDGIEELRRRAAAIQEALQEADDIVEVSITRDGARIVRLERKNEKL